MAERKPDAPDDDTRDREGATTDQLRDDIDAGRTGDKVGFPDPAAAPLGTDAEAGGAPPEPEEVARVSAEETGRGDSPKAAPGRPVTSPRDPDGTDTGMRNGIVIGAIVLIVVIALVGFLI